MKTFFFLFLLLGGACAARRPPSSAGSQREVQLALASALVEGGNPDAALRLLHASGPAEGADLALLEARALREAGLKTAAEAELRALVRRHPRDAAAWQELGFLALDRGDPEDAISNFTVALRRDPDNSVFLNNLGFAQLVARQPVEAADTLGRALALDGGSVRIRLNLGFALAAAGRTDAALELFRATGSAADAQYKLGVACELWSSPEDAARAYSAALALDARHAGARAALNRLGATGLPEEVGP